MTGSGETGYIHSIETFGTVDDGGIRFVLFMQGCVMRCQFCHNPDTWLRQGKKVTVEEIIAQLEDYRDYFRRSGGGLTVSGGEPLLQYRFVAALFAACGERGIHRTLDTSGYCRHGQFEPAARLADRILFSLKVVDRERHLWLTGVDNGVILDNLTLAARLPAELVVRYVLIPGINDSADDLQALARTVRALPAEVPVDLLPYHRMGLAKWRQLGLDCALVGVREPTAGEIAAASALLAREGIRSREGQSGRT